MDRLRCMRVFARVAHLGSFAAAGRELRLSAASVTKLVAALEAELGVRLLERTTRKVQLTEAGRFYLDRCSETLQSIDDIDAAMSQMSRLPSGTLRVTAPADLARDLSRVIASYARQYEKVTVDLRLTNQNVDLVEQGFDLGIGLLAPSHGSYISRRLCTSRVGVFAAPEYLAVQGTPKKPSDLVRHRNIVFVEPAPRTVWNFHKGKRNFKVELAPAALSNSGTALTLMCVEGMGLITAPSFVVQAELHSGLIVPVLTEYELTAFGIYVRYPSRRFLPAKVRSFIESLRQYFGPDPNADIWWTA